MSNTNLSAPGFSASQNKEKHTYTKFTQCVSDPAEDACITCIFIQNTPLFPDCN